MHTEGNAGLNGKLLVSIIAAGLSKFGKHEGLYTREIFSLAAKEAFDRCPKLDPKSDIKAMFIGHMGESYEHQGHTASAVADWVGLLNIPATRTEAACASSGATPEQLKIGMELTIDFGTCSTAQPWPQWPRYCFKPL